MSPWIPISTVPKDGKLVDLWATGSGLPLSGARFANCYWENNEDGEVWVQQGIVSDGYYPGNLVRHIPDFTPTHWALPPTSPAD